MICKVDKLPTAENFLERKELRRKKHSLRCLNGKELFYAVVLIIRWDVSEKNIFSQRNEKTLVKTYDLLFKKN